MRAEHRICYMSVSCTKSKQYLRVLQAKLNTQRLAVHEAVKPELCHLRYCLSAWGPRVSPVTTLPYVFAERATSNRGASELSTCCYCAAAFETSCSNEA